LKLPAIDGVVAHLVGLPACSLGLVIITYCYRLLPTKRQHRALEAILEGQQLGIVNTFQSN